MKPEDTRHASLPEKSGDSSSQFDLAVALDSHEIGRDGPRPPSSGNPRAWIGRSLGRYRITDVLGQGGTGVVLGAARSDDRSRRGHQGAQRALAADASALGRFLAEAKAAGKLSHPNVVTVYEICQDGSTHYLVMEYVSGGSLDDWLAGREFLPLPEATRALIDACKGIGAAHAAGLIHRDVKPANFMRAADGSIKVADFGLAKSTTDIGNSLTQIGAVVGTPYFMSPEQCEGKPLDQRSDLYSLGASYYRLLTGKYPYQETESTFQVMFHHCYGPILDPRSVVPSLPAACSRIIAKAMAKCNPDHRYQSTDEMLDDLARRLPTPRLPRRCSHCPP